MEEDLFAYLYQKKKLDHLNLKLMSDDNKSRHKTPFTVSIEAKEGISTGISAKDRSTTIQTAINPQAREEDIVTPGHIFPLKAKDGGVLLEQGIQKQQLISVG